jgi:hypothetical protein
MNLLILSHAYNRDGRADALTVTDKIPYLLAAGVKVTVISAPTGDKDHRLPHLQVFSALPAGLKFELRQTLSQPWRGLVNGLLAPLVLLEKCFFRYEAQWSWSISAYLCALYQLKKAKKQGKTFDWIYSSGGASAAHWAAHRLKSKTGLSWVAEVHDPLVHAGSTPHPRDQRAKTIEALIAQQADVAVFFTEGAVQAVQKRHPNIRAKVLLPGAEAPSVRVAYQRQHPPILAHFGSLAATRNLKMAMEVVDQLNEDGFLITLVQYGQALEKTSQAAWAAMRHPNAFRHGGRLSRTHAQQAMQRADALFLHHGIEPYCPEYVPSKLYDYLWAGRPVVATVWQNPFMWRLVEERGHKAVSADDAAGLYQAIKSVLQNPTESDPQPYTVQAAVAQWLQWLQACDARVVP